MSYRVERHAELRDLIEIVNDALAAGWELHGSAVVEVHELGGFVRYLQVLIKREDRGDAAEKR